MNTIGQQAVGGMMPSTALLLSHLLRRSLKLTEITLHAARGVNTASNLMQPSKAVSHLADEELDE